MIIDSHCHLHDEKFAEDLPEVLARAKQAGISHMVTIGCDLKTTENAARVAHSVPEVYFTAGFHPHDAKHMNDVDFKAIGKLAQDKKCVAIGECGLDYYYLHSSIDEQKTAFTKQIELALEQNLPLVIHLRDAFDDCVSILKSYQGLSGRVVIHCFSGTLKQAQLFAGMGFFISLSGIITFKKPGELLDVARTIALEQLLVETDAPYLAPHPLRGKRNEPELITYTIDAIAQARGQDATVIKEQTYKNTKQFFGI
jgi:TatD DNase family protein